MTTTMSAHPGPSLNDAVLAEIRSHMGRQRVNQRALAEAIGRDPFWLSRRMRGETLLTLEDAASIADALGLTMVELLPRLSRATGEYTYELAVAA